jgi:hypothetical protein
MNRFSFSSFMSHRPAVCAAVIAAAGLALAGCGASASSSSGSSSGTTSGSAASGQAAASTSANSGTSGSGLGTAASMFPATVGNTWVYAETLSAAEKGTVTNRITAVAPIAGGERVTMSSSDSLAGLGAATTPSTVTLILHSDGSISLPLTQLGSSAVKVKSGSVVWPSAAVLASGQPRTDTLVITAAVAGQTLTIAAHVVVRGAGSATVTVPAGTYQTTLIDETITEHIEGIALSTEIQNWDANGVGPVKTAVLTTAGSKTTIVSTQELKSFTKG